MRFLPNNVFRTRLFIWHGIGFLDLRADRLVQQTRAARLTVPGRTYTLAGLLHCGMCGRRMESHWTQRPAYRCRHGHSSAVPPLPHRTPNAYVREDHVLPHLPALIIRLTGHKADLNASAAPPVPVAAV
ncbi:zinc ribbon domain-containing protein [Streptomyces hyaluromycini]|uniref:Zinc ribbon domain-containing protein n=1 Tax=Streptomyces hyaluromycini TaxID=1377993 RepID=A0ABV1WNL4_9ACTN